jgi:hypothetical protein
MNVWVSVYLVLHKAEAKKIKKKNFFFSLFYVFHNIEGKKTNRELKTINEQR